MRTFGVRTKPTDRRYLSDQDKSDYNQSGAYANRAKAVSRVRKHRGDMAYSANAPMNTTTLNPGTGGYTQGISIQQDRLRQIGDNKRAAEAHRPEMKNIYENLYT